MANWIEYTEPKWRELDMEKLGIDEAYLRTISSSDKTNWLYTLNEACHKCPYTKFFEISPHKVHHGKIEIAQGISLKIFDKDVGAYAFENETAICTMDHDMGEFGVYNISIAENQTCTFATDKEPVNIYLPLILVTLISTIIFVLIQTILRRKTIALTSIEKPANDLHLDTNKIGTIEKPFDCAIIVRGFAVLIMIFVNGGAGGYWWVFRSSWNGLQLGDLVFPFFSWCMGVFIPMATKSQMDEDVPKKKIWFGTIMRTIKLFIVGVYLNSVGGPKLSNIRIMGILQRLGIANFVIASLYVLFTTNKFTLPQNRIKKAFYDIILIWPLWLFGFVLIVIHTTIIFGLQVPGCPSGYLGPGGLHALPANRECVGGAAGFIDRLVLGVPHILQHPDSQKVYRSPPFDPEGLLGCLLTTVHALIGVQSGMILMIFKESRARVKRWLLWSIVLIMIAAVLSRFSHNDGWIPINKHLTSISFVLLTSGIAFFLQAIAYFAMYVKRVWSGAPLLQLGMNGLLIYIGQIVFAHMLPFYWNVGFMNTHFVILLKSLWATVLWTICAFFLFQKKFFFVL